MNIEQLLSAFLLCIFIILWRFVVLDKRMLYCSYTFKVKWTSFSSLLYWDKEDDNTLILFKLFVLSTISLSINIYKSILLLYVNDIDVYVLSTITVLKKWIELFDSMQQVNFWWYGIFLRIFCRDSILGVESC